MATQHRFGQHTLIQADGTALTTEERLDLALRDPAAPAALTPHQVKGITQNRIRSAMAELAHGSIDDVKKWMTQTAEGLRDSDGKMVSMPNPKAAVELFLQLAEFSLPKLKAVAIDVRSPDGSMKTLSVADLEKIVSEQ